MIQGWKYYNHAVIPVVCPHEIIDTTPIYNNQIWKTDEKPLLARWTSDFDCGFETKWWYVIKDTPFDIMTLKSKRRYEINKGIKNFIVKEISPSEWCEEIWNVTIAAYRTYPKSYRPNISHDSFVSSVSKWKYYKTYGAFYVADNSLCGYACLIRKGEKDNSFINFCMMKAIPEKEKHGLNAAMVNKILVDHDDYLRGTGYICDGERNIQHKTAFQDYLEKYFGFRKAYCKLHIAYNPKYKHIINIAYRFRTLIACFDRIPIVSTISALMRMEEISRESTKTK